MNKRQIKKESKKREYQLIMEDSKDAAPEEGSNCKL
jgi:hypothetical protein